jgi:hypothetical protein
MVVLIPKFASEAAARACELRNRDTGGRAASHVGKRNNKHRTAPFSGGIVPVYLAYVGAVLLAIGVLVLDVGLVPAQRA